MKKTITTIIILLLSLGVYAQEYLNKGDKVTDFTFETIDGQQVNIKDLKGKVVYINFFATWCGPCLKELAMMEDNLLNEIKSDEFYFIALGRGHTAEQLITFKENKSFNFNIGMDTDKQLFLRFSEKGIPLNIILDRDGEIIMKKTGFSEASFKKIRKTIKREL